MNHFYLRLLIWLTPVFTATLNAQLYDQTFDTSGQGVNANCTPCSYSSPGPYVWTLSGPSLDSDDYFNTSNTVGSLEAKDLDGEFCFETEVIDISGVSDIITTINLSESGNHENTDYVDVYYNLDNAGFVLIEDWNGGGSTTHTLINDYDSESIDICLSGSSLIIRICIINDANTELDRIDRVLVEEDTNSAETLCTDCSSIASCGPCAFPPIAPNQMLEPCESLNIAFVIDESGSVSSSSQDVAEGVLGFVNAIICPNAKIAIIEFNGTARYVIDDYVTIDQSVLDGMDDYFAPGGTYNGQSYNPGSNTNWEDAMHLVDSFSTTPDIILFFTDGQPTSWGQGINNTCGSGGSTERPEIVNPMKLANKLKDEGAHMFMLGVGGVTETNLINMSGPVEFESGTNSIATSDYTLGSFVSLADDLAAFAQDLCPFSECTQVPACPGESNGQIIVNIENAPAGTLFKWSYEEFYTSVTDSGSTTLDPFIITDLPSGLYDVSLEVEVSAGCIRPASGCIIEVTSLQTNTLNASQSSCTGSMNGGFDLGVFGGLPPYTYQITDGMGVNLNGTLLEDDTISITGLDPSSYFITVTGAGVNLCQTLDTVVVGNAMNGPIVSCSVVQQVSCYGAADGVAEVSASGGHPLFIYVE